MEQQRSEIGLADPIEETRSIEKHHGTKPTETITDDGNTQHWHSHVSRRLAGYMKRFEQQLVEYNIEARGIQRVEEQERHALTWVTYLQVFLLWVSINLAANNITLGMLGPSVYGLSFLDSSLCSVFGAIVGSLAAAWSATWGPVSGNRTLVRSHASVPQYGLYLRCLTGLWSLCNGMVAEQDYCSAEHCPNDRVRSD